MRRSIPRKKAWRLCSFRYFLPLVSFWLPVSCMPRLNQIKIEMLPTYLTYSPQRARRSGATVPRTVAAVAKLLWSLAQLPALVISSWRSLNQHPESYHRNHTNLLTILQDTRLVRESLRHGVLLAAVAQPATTERILTLLIWHWLAHAGGLLGRVGKSGTNRPFRFRFRGGNRT